jgi:hypothetical protein
LAPGVLGAWGCKRKDVTGFEVFAARRIHEPKYGFAPGKERIPWRAGALFFNWAVREDTTLSGGETAC